MQEEKDLKEEEIEAWKEESLLQLQILQRVAEEKEAQCAQWEKVAKAKESWAEDVVREAAEAREATLKQC